MNHFQLIVAALMLPAFANASQLQYKVQLKEGDCIVFNQNGDLRIEKSAWETHLDFDFGLINAMCPAVCGAKCPMDILSKSAFYIFKTSPVTFPLFGQPISLTVSQFDTSSKYLNLDSLNFYNIPFENFRKYYIFKTNANKYALFVIDSLKTHDVCTVPSPCCNATTIECVYGKILFQTNGLPQFDLPVSIAEKKVPAILNHKTSSLTYQMLDVQGRALSYNARTTAGIRLIVKPNGIAGRSVVLDYKMTAREKLILK